MILRRNLTILLVLTVFTWAIPIDAGYKLINKPNAADPMSVHIYQLDNGLTVYLTENPEEPRFYAEISVRVGGKHDPAESTGLAHYLEHLLFKGTRRLGTLDYEKEKVYIDRIEALYEEHWKETDEEKRKTIYAEINRQTQLAAQYAIPNEIDRLYQAMGSSRMNAHTGKDNTTYEVDLPANRLEQWAMIESERFQNPVFRLFQPELEIVYEEKNRSLDNKESVIGEPVLEALFQIHPYGQQTTIGTVEHLKNPSLANIHAFFSSYYVPNNMAIAISGDIDISTAIETLDRHFSAWKRKELPEPQVWTEEPPAGIKVVEVTYPGEELVVIAYRTPGKKHPDHDAWILADYAMSNGRAGLVDLVNQRQEVRQAQAWSSPYLDYSYEQFRAVPKKGQTLEEARDILLGQIDALRNGEFDDDMIPSVIAQFKKDDKASLESNTGRVGKLTNAFISLRDWDDDVHRLSRMETITKADIVRVANEYFHEDYVLGYRRDAQHDVPKIEKPAIDKIDIDPTRQSEFARAIAAVDVEPLIPRFVDPDVDYRIVEVHPGVKLYYSQNPLNDLFSLNFHFDIGFNQNVDIPYAKLLHDRAGTEKLSPEDLKKAWYRMGTDFVFNTDNNDSYFSISGLEENFDASLELMLEFIRNPKADQETLEKLIQIQLGRRETSKKDPRFLQLALLLYGRHGDESRLIRRPPAEVVQKLNVDHLLNIVKELSDYEHSIVYTGSRSVDAIVAAIRQHHKLKKKLEEPLPYRVDRVRSVPETEILVLQKEMAASRVNVEMGDLIFQESLTPRIEMFNEYFSGGMSSIVFQELREARALAYQVHAQYYLLGRPARREDQNLMWGIIVTQADKTPESAAAMLDLWENLPTSEERYAASQRAIINTYETAKLGFREVIGAVRNWERLGVDVDPRKARYEQIQDLKLDDVIGFQKEHIAGKPRIVSVLGDTTKMDMTQLRKLGTVRIVEIEQTATF